MDYDTGLPFVIWDEITDNPDVDVEGWIEDWDEMEGYLNGYEGIPSPYIQGFEEGTLKSSSLDGNLRGVRYFYKRLADERYSQEEEARSTGSTSTDWGYGRAD